MSLFRRKRPDDKHEREEMAIRLRETQERSMDNMLRIERIVKAARIASVRRVNGVS